LITIVVNAISVKEGGSLVVLRELVLRMVAMQPGWNWKIIVHNKIRERLPEHPSLDYRSFPLIDKHSWLVYFWYQLLLPRLLKELNASLLFSITNYLPRRKLGCRTLLLVQHAGHFSDVFNRLIREKLNIIGKIAWWLKCRWVKQSVTLADRVTVQTRTLAQRIISETQCNTEHVRVIAHGCGQVNTQSMTITPPDLEVPWRIGYITKAGIQKNFAVLIQAVERLKNKGYTLRLVLTLASEGKANREVMALSRQHGITELIENHGEVQPGTIEKIYQSLHIFVFPSLCESFGFPMVEAMAHGLPLLIADIDSNIEVAGNGGTPFPADGPEELACELEKLIINPGQFRLCAGESLKRSHDYQWHYAARNTLSLMEEIIVHS